MKRWVFNIGAGVSLVLCIAVGILWIRSYWREDMIFVRRNDSRGYCTSLNGGITVEIIMYSTTWLTLKEVEFRSRKVLDALIDDGKELNGWPLPIPQDHWGFAFDLFDDQYRSYMPTGFIGDYWIVIPYWAVAVVTFSTSALLVIPSWYRRKRRITRGLCPICGYDLRATPERCPECGTPVNVG